MRIRHVDSAIAVTGKARFVRCLEWMNHTGALILGVGGRDHQILGWVSSEARGGSLGLWTGGETLLYLIVYRNYVRKW